MAETILSTDYVADAYAALWDIVFTWPAIADSDFVRRGNRIRFDGGEAFPPKAAKTFTKAPADLPEFSLDIGTHGNVGYTANPMTFGTAAGQTCAPRVAEFTEQFVFRIVGDGVSIVPLTQIRTEVENALGAAGPRLGIAGVVGWGPVTGGSRREERKGKERRVLEIILPVRFRPTA